MYNLKHVREVRMCVKQNMRYGDENNELFQSGGAPHLEAVRAWGLHMFSITLAWDNMTHVLYHTPFGGSCE
jgi:hypothetical protein